MTEMNVLFDNFEAKNNDGVGYILHKRRMILNKQIGISFSQGFESWFERYSESE